MNRYRVTLTVFSAESFVAEVEAMDKDHARRFGEESAERQYPDASEIRVDEVELLTSAPEPTPDPLAQARDIIAGLLDAAALGVEDMGQLAAEAQYDMDAGIVRAVPAAAWLEKERRTQETIATARAFLATKEPTT